MLLSGFLPIVDFVENHFAENLSPILDIISALADNKDYFKPYFKNLPTFLPYLPLLNLRGLVKVISIVAIPMLLSGFLPIVDFFESRFAENLSPILDTIFVLADNKGYFKPYFKNLPDFLPNLPLLNLEGLVKVASIFISSCLTFALIFQNAS